MIAFFLHIYYPDSLPALLKQLRPLLNGKNYLFINLVRDTFPEMPELPEQENIIVIRSTNKGKDIGGKLLLLDLYLRLHITTEYLVFLHDKKSPHAATGSFWKSELYKIIDATYFGTIASIFTHKKDVGLVGAEIFIQDEWHASTKLFDTTNHTILLSLLNQYGFSLNNYYFMAGTMFWVRSSIYTKFFSQHAPLEIRADFEEDDILDIDEGRVTHAWERMLSWIVTAQGYKLYGI